MSSRWPRPSPALVGRGFSLRPRDDLIDHVVAEPARCEERVDLALALGRLERLPAPELACDRSSGAVRLALSGRLPEGRFDRLSSDAFAAELTHERAVALWSKARALLDPVLGEVEIVDISLGTELVDRAIDGFVLVALTAQVAADLGD